MKNIRYLCNMNAKNLYSNTNWEPMLIALALIKKYPPQLSYRLKRQKAKTYRLQRHSGQNLSLLLLAQAFSGRAFCVERRAYDF